MILPQSGARILLGSDGLWDIISWEEAARISRQMSVMDAASKVITTALIKNDWRYHDDVTAIMIDVLPSDSGEFPKVVKQKANRAYTRKKAQSQSCLVACLCSKHRNGNVTAMDSQCDEMHIVAHFDGLELLKKSERMHPDDCSLPDLNLRVVTRCSDVGPVHSARAQRTAGYWYPERLGRPRSSCCKIPDSDPSESSPGNRGPVDLNVPQRRSDYVPLRQANFLVDNCESIQRVPFCLQPSGLGIPYDERPSYEVERLQRHQFPHDLSGGRHCKSIQHVPFCLQHSELEMPYDERPSFQLERLQSNQFRHDLSGGRHPESFGPFSNSRNQIDERTSLEQEWVHDYPRFQRRHFNAATEVIDFSSQARGYYDERTSLDLGRLPRRW